jgi:hypothetical protein
VPSDHGLPVRGGRPAPPGVSPGNPAWARRRARLPHGGGALRALAQADPLWPQRTGEGGVESSTRVVRGGQPLRRAVRRRDRREPQEDGSGSLLRRRLRRAHPGDQRGSVPRARRPPSARDARGGIQPLPVTRPRLPADRPAVAQGREENGSHVRVPSLVFAYRGGGRLAVRGRREVVRGRGTGD